VLLKLKYNECAVLFILTFFNVCTVAQDKGLSKEDIAKVETMTLNWLAAHADRDWDKLATHYTDDAILMPPFAPIITGRNAIRNWFSENENFTSVQIEIIDIQGYEDLAYVRGKSLVIIEKPGQDTVTIEGKYLDIRRRSADGSWKVFIDMFSPDNPVE